MTITVLLVDDDRLLRTGVAAVLGTAEGIEVVGEAGDGREAVALTNRLRPDIALMDVRMPTMDGIEATRRIVAAGAPTRVIVLTTFEHDEYVIDGLRAGASAFLLKRTPPEALIEAVRTVAAGDALLDPAVTRRLVERALAAAPPAAGRADLLDRLTERETEVLRLIAAGRSNSEIAEDLVIAPSTIKTHVKHVLRKLGARDRAQAVMLAYETGLVRPGGSAPDR